LATRAGPRSPWRSTTRPQYERAPPPLPLRPPRYDYDYDYDYSYYSYYYYYYYYHYYYLPYYYYYYHHVVVLLPLLLPYHSRPLTPQVHHDRGNLGRTGIFELCSDDVKWGDHMFMDDDNVYMFEPRNATLFLGPYRFLRHANLATAAGGRWILTAYVGRDIVRWCARRGKV